MNNKKFEKTLTYILIGIISAIALTHTWRPITISPTDSNERLGFTFLLLFMAWAFYSGYRCARLTIGFTFALFGAVNFLILLFYFNRIETGNLFELTFWTILLSAISYILLRWKAVRIFEAEKQNRTVQNA